VQGAGLLGSHSQASRPLARRGELYILYFS
jgi:hypothetical protein